MDLDKLVLDAVRGGVAEAVKQRFSSNYDNPLSKHMTAAIDAQGAALRGLVGECIASCVGDPAFRAEVAQAVRHSLAKTLVSRFGGELEKQVNVLKSDPTTRARITLAIEAIVKEKCAAT